MENLVVTLETAGKLKAAGFPQTAHLFWHRSTIEQGDDLLPELNNDPEFSSYDFSVLAAPTAQEIADQLPREIEAIQLAVGPSRDKGFWLAGYPAMNVVLPQGKGPTMAEALALLWQKLQEAK